MGRRILLKIGVVITTLIGLSASLSAAENTMVTPERIDQTIYYGGDIITMEGDEPVYVEAVLERNGRIIYAGDKTGAVNNFAGETLEVDLKGNTMMPGFIEPHAHPVSIGGFILANDIAAPHEWRMPHKTYPGVSGRENYLQAVKDIIDSKEDRSKTVMIWGYHKSWHGMEILRCKTLIKSRAMSRQSSGNAQPTSCI